MPALYVIAIATVLGAGVLAAIPGALRGAPVDELARAGAVGVAAAVALFPIVTCAVVAMVTRRYLRSADTAVHVLEADGNLQTMIVLRRRDAIVEGVAHARLRHPAVDGAARSLRREVFDRLRPVADRDGLTLHLRAASRRLVRHYAADLPGLVETPGRRSHIGGSVAMHRPPNGSDLGSR